MIEGGQSKGVLLRDVFSHRPRSKSISFAPDVIQRSETVRYVAKNFDIAESVIATWVLSVFYLCLTQDTPAARRIQKQWNIPVGTAEEKLVVISGAPGLLLLGQNYSQSKPEVQLIKPHLDTFEESILQIAPHCVLDGRNNEAPQLLTDRLFVKGLVKDVFKTTLPQIGLAATPKATYVSAPTPPLPAASGVERSTAGVLARDLQGNVVMTMAYHGTGPEGTEVILGGKKSVVSKADRVVDASIAPMPPPYPESTHAMALSTQPPGIGQKMYFCGLASKTQKTTYVDAVDPSIAAPELGEQVRIYTRNDSEHGELNRGDSGCVLVNEQRQVAGFAFVRTRQGAAIRLSKWIWAKSVFDALGLTEY